MGLGTGRLNTLPLRAPASAIDSIPCRPQESQSCDDPLCRTATARRRPMDSGGEWLRARLRVARVRKRYASGAGSASLRANGGTTHSRAPSGMAYAAHQSERACDNSRGDRARVSQRKTRAWPVSVQLRSPVLRGRQDLAPCPDTWAAYPTSSCAPSIFRSRQADEPGAPPPARRYRMFRTTP